MKEQTRNNISEMKIMANGSREGKFDPLQTIPINRTEWYSHIEERIEEEVDTDEYNDRAIAKATIDQVSYTNEETGECDVRYEARYEILV